VLLVSWNVAGRLALLRAQADEVLGAGPDLVALQEVTRTTAPRWRGILEAEGFAVHVALAPAAEARGARRLGTLVASRMPLEPRPGLRGVPWPERAAAAQVESPAGPLVLVSAYVPQARNGWVKVETLEALVAALAAPGPPRILAGDLNTPRTETPDGRVATFAQRRVGARPIPERGERWDLAERRILVGLEPLGMLDVFRALHGYGPRDLSWTWPRHRGGYRLDHVLASASLRPTACRYRHAWREMGLSDHSGMEAAFS
jgi:exodeoxyribonuclease III